MLTFATSFHPRFAARLLFLLLGGACLSAGLATPVNRAALDRHYDRFLAKELNRCTTCHLPSEHKDPQGLDEFPHNPFGDRLRQVGRELAAVGKAKDIPARLAVVAREDSDGDGVPNEVEILLGHNPGDAKDAPGAKELATLRERQAAFAKYLASYRWRPFETVRQPPVPKVKDPRRSRNPIDAFIAAGQEARELKPRPPAAKEVLMRRAYLDLIGLTPTPEEQRAFLADKSTDAYERLVDRLLDDPRHGERWGRHWMDVWRYSDWAGWSDGNQIRDSQPHIWRWRDWIVESLNENKSYDRMLQEMLAADELAPLDAQALRATGFLARNYKMLSREQWMEDTVKHTAQAFLGVTVGCAKCHDHMFDPVTQVEYYQMRAIFDPHQVRTDRLPGELDTAKVGLSRAFDAGTNLVTHLLMRGDERRPDTNSVMEPGVPLALAGLTPAAKAHGRLDVTPVSLPPTASQPDRRAFVTRDMVTAAETALAEARIALGRLRTNTTLAPDKLKEQELASRAAEAKQEAFLAAISAERLEEVGKKDSGAWRQAATVAGIAQRKQALLEAELKAHQARLALVAAEKAVAEAAKTPATTATNLTETAQADAAKKRQEKADKAAKDLEAAKKKGEEADKTLAEAAKAAQAAPTAACQPRNVPSFPATSTGRRLAFAKWVTDANNPLTARVAMNHLWLRHFGRGIVSTPADFGRNGRPPSHPELLDWLAARFMALGWDMKAMHRLMLTSDTYRQASTPDEADEKIDPDNIYLWRMNSRRMEAEVVRDNLLQAAGNLDRAMGGPEIDQKLGLSSKRRSLYLRLAAEKEVEFLKLFDGPSVTECYERRPSVMPQQALALANSEMALAQAKVLAKAVSAETEGDSGFIQRAFTRILAREPKAEEVRMCQEFLTSGVSAQGANPQRARENLVLVLFNHNDFVAVR